MWKYCFVDSRVSVSRTGSRPVPGGTAPRPSGSGGVHVGTKLDRGDRRVPALLDRSRRRSISPGSFQGARGGGIAGADAPCSGGYRAGGHPLHQAVDTIPSRAVSSILGRSRDLPAVSNWSLSDDGVSAATRETVRVREEDAGRTSTTSARIRLARRGRGRVLDGSAGVRRAGAGKTPRPRRGRRLRGGGDAGTVRPPIPSMPG